MRSAHFCAYGVLVLLLYFYPPHRRRNRRNPTQPTTQGESYLLKPARVFDGEAMREGWGAVIRGNRIESAGPLAELKAPTEAKMVELCRVDALAGMIESAFACSFTSI